MQFARDGRQVWIGDDCGSPPVGFGPPVLGPCVHAGTHDVRMPAALPPTTSSMTSGMMVSRASASLLDVMRFMTGSPCQSFEHDARQRRIERKSASRKHPRSLAVTLAVDDRHTRVTSRAAC